LDVQTGQVHWKTLLGGQIQTTALVANGLVYTASRKASVIALDAQTGKKKWEYDYGPNNWVESSPLLVGDVIYIGSSGNEYVVGLDSRYGNLLTAYTDKVCFWSTPLVVGDKLYMGGAANTQMQAPGGLFSLILPAKATPTNLSPIKYKWLFPVTKTLTPDGIWAGVASSPIMQDGVIYFGGLDGKLYALK
jgi:outer membrane protein assembly factor BamB